MKLIVHKIFVYSICFILLASFSVSGYADIICLGENGHVELETICIPSCSEIENSSQFATEDNAHEEHAECSNCSDVEIDNHFWSKRTQKTDSKYSIICKSGLLSIITHNFSASNLQYQLKKFTSPLEIKNTPLDALSSIILIC